MRSIGLLCVLAVCPLACSQASDPDAPHHAQDDDDSSAGDNGNMDESGVTCTIDIEMSEAIPTVAIVHGSVTGSGIEAVHFEYGRHSAYPRGIVVPVQDGGTFDFDLIGLKPAAAYLYNLAVRVDGAWYTSDKDSFSTGPVPAHLPRLLRTEYDGDVTPEGYLLTSLLGDPSYAVIFDTDGELVWWKEIVDPPQFTTMRIAHGGKHFYAMEANGIQVLGFDGTEIDQHYLPNIHHDYTVLPDGTIAALAFDVRYPDVLNGEEVFGQQIVEISPEGAASSVWSLWEAEQWQPSAFHENDNGWELGHANIIRYSPDDDAYYVSFLQFGSIWKIDRSSGDVLWKLGGGHTEFHVEGQQAINLFRGGQHGFDILDGGILVFRNGLNSLAANVVECGLDEDDYTVDVEWTYELDPPSAVYVLGDVSRLDDGHTLITWSTAGQVDMVDDTGKLVWSLNSPLGFGIGYTTMVGSFYEDADVR